MIRRWIHVVLLVAATGSLQGCAAIRELFRDPRDAVSPIARPDRIYEALVENYVELCAVSQYRPRDGTILEGAVGGSPGHAVMYLKGACRDESAPYPRLRPCRFSALDRSDPEHGAGVSVNRLFKNVNWVATPGKLLFFDGELSSYELLDEARFHATAERAIELEMYRGVELHPFDGEKEPPDLRRFVELESLGTDFALRFGRTVFCTRLPMPDEMMTRTMDFLNALNEEYWSGKAEYNWSGYSDNCVHTLHNALAAAGVWKPKSIQGTKLRQFFNLAVPANTFVDLAYLSNQFPIEDFDRVRRDRLHWQGLTEDGWVPAAPGALVKMLPVHQVNALYDTKYRMFVLGGLFKNDARKRAQHLLTDGRYLQLDANLRYFFERYQRILAERDETSWRDSWRSDQYHQEREAYYAYIERQRDGVIDTLRRLERLDKVREEILQGAISEWEVRAPEALRGP